MAELTERHAWMDAEIICRWEQNNHDDWETDCGSAFRIIEGTPQDNEMEYCCYCGNPLKGIPFPE